MALREDPEFARNPSYLRDELIGAHVWRVGGVGAFAYAEDTEVELLRQSAFREYTAGNDREDWLHAARARTAAYESAEANGGIVPLLRWVLVESWAKIPNDALPIGHDENQHVLYASRVWFCGGLHIGKAGDHLAVRCATSVEGRVHSAPTFEVLCGSLETVEWVPVEPGQPAVFPGLQPVEGGRQSDGRAILIARGEHHNLLTVSGCLVDDDHASVPYDSRDDRLESYEVLTYATTHRR
ncbi:hypothetical protein VHUM_01835 [Vanrija humicola]|uniref:Uncharacterized protein n=1 Tax=Vanrija humicola TaxID=5417 RepID=A0A7D8ZS53_VANHU|nr:hypothetical protein VHUM_01835 [Vanrija humicola]